MGLPLSMIQLIKISVKKNWFASISPRSKSIENWGLENLSLLIFLARRFKGNTYPGIFSCINQIKVLKENVVFYIYIWSFLKVCTNTEGSHYCKCKEGMEPIMECRPVIDLGLANGGLPDSSIYASGTEEGYSKNMLRLTSGRWIDTLTSQCARPWIKKPK